MGDDSRGRNRDPTKFSHPWLPGVLILHCGRRRNGSQKQRLYSVTATRRGAMIASSLEINFVGTSVDRRPSESACAAKWIDLLLNASASWKWVNGRTANGVWRANANNVVVRSNSTEMNSAIELLHSFWRLDLSSLSQKTLQTGRLYLVGLYQVGYEKKLNMHRP